MMYENPPKIRGIYPKKGAIKIGSYSNQTITNSNVEGIIRKENQYSLAGRTTYEGGMVKEVPVATIMKGVVIADDCAIAGRRGFDALVSFLRERNG